MTLYFIEEKTRWYRLKLEQSVLTLFRPGFFWSSTTGGGGGRGFRPPLRNSENIKATATRLLRVDSMSENVSFDLRITRL